MTWQKIYKVPALTKTILTTYQRVMVLHLSHPPKISVFQFLFKDNDRYIKTTIPFDCKKVSLVCKNVSKNIDDRG